jgi:hypothetical protein
MVTEIHKEEKSLPVHAKGDRSNTSSDKLKRLLCLHIRRPERLQLPRGEGSFAKTPIGQNCQIIEQGFGP